MNLHEQKLRLRNELKQRRSELPENKRNKMSKQIINFLHEIEDFNQAKNIFCYMSYLSEVETSPLINHFIEQDLTLAVPKIIGNTEMIAVELTHLTDIEPDKMGIMTPKSNQKVSLPFDIAITPGVGFTDKGDRLGYGRGYYDRWFVNNEVKTKIGIAFEAQVVETLPTEETDISLDILVTEERIIDLRNHV